MTFQRNLAPALTNSANVKYCFCRKFSSYKSLLLFLLMSAPQQKMGLKSGSMNSHKNTNG